MQRNTAIAWMITIFAMGIAINQTKWIDIQFVTQSEV